MYVWRKYSQTTTKTLVYVLRLQIEKRGDLTASLITLDLVSGNLDYLHTMKLVSEYPNLNCLKYEYKFKYKCTMHTVHLFDNDYER